MKKKLLCTLLSLNMASILGAQNTPAQQPAAPKITPQQALTNLQTRFDDTKVVAQALFNPVFPNSNPPKPNPYPTTSINERLVDTFYGANGLKVDPSLLGYIKNFYFFIEYITKLEYAALIAAYADRQNLDTITLLEKKGWQGFIDAVVKQNAGDFTKLISTIDSLNITPNFDDIKNTIVVSSWQNVISTPFWKAIPVSLTMIRNSSFWQDYCKYAVTRSFVIDASTLESVYQTELSIFRFIPNIEVAYYHPDFIQLRNSSEFNRLRLILNGNMRNRYIAQSKEWSHYIDPRTGTYNLIKIYENSLLFQKTNFYQLISLSDTKTLGELTQLALDKKLPFDPKYITQPLVQEKLQCLAMFKNLQAQTYYLFDGDHLDQTIALLNNSKNLPEPSLLSYAADDAIYLDDLDHIMQNYKNPEKLENMQKNAGLKLVMTSTESRDESVAVQDFGSWLSGLWSDVKQTGLDVWQGVQDFGKAAVDEAEVVGLNIASTFIGGTDPQAAQEFMTKSRQLQQEVAQEITNSAADAQNIISDTAKVATDAAYGAAGVVGSVFGAFDKKLGQDVEGLLDAQADLLIDYYADAGHEFVAEATGLVRLTVDAANYATTLVADTVIGAKTGDWSALGQDALNGIKNIAYDVVSSIISVATFMIQSIVDQVKAMVKFAGYLVSIVTDLAIDAFKAVFNGLASALSAFGVDNAVNPFENIGDALENHRRLIEATVTTGLLVAAVVATDGLALPVLAMTVGPQAFQVVGGYQSDERTIAKKKEERDFVSNFQTYVNNNETIAQNAKASWADELDKKYNAQITNQERELGFYQNFMQSYFENMEQQMAYYLGGSLTPQITPDPNNNGLLAADVGTIYGFKTGVFDLNPSQGFPLYNAGRKAFSQEIAVSPALAISDDDQKATASSTPLKFWFNQKETIPLNQETQTVEIRWRAIYTLNMFYIGLYFGGEPIDFDTIKKSGAGPLDSGHLAKMIVFKKENKEDAASLNLYEHEGKGWIGKIQGPDFSIGQWYHMRATLSGKTIEIQVWKDGEMPNGSQSFDISPTPQKTLGVISSGASIEYQVILPTITPQTVAPLRPSGNLGLQPEKQRESKARTQLASLLSPSLGSLNLQAAQRELILRGLYIYNTNATKLLDQQKNPLADYVVLGQANFNQEGGTTIGNIGQSPADALQPGAADPVVVSLITQNAYDKNGKHIATCPNVLDSLTQVHGQLPDVLTTQITNLRKQYSASQTTPFMFGSLSLQATSADDIVQGHFIYKGISPLPELKDKQGVAIKGSQGIPLYDYFLMKSRDGVLGVPYDPSINTIRSLVSGYEYNKGSSTPTGAHYRPMLSSYQQNNGTLSATLLNSINASITAYQQAAKQEEAQSGSSQTTTAQPVTTGSIANPSGGYTGAPSGTPQQVTQGSTQQSIQERQEQAGGDQLSIGG
ncbi:hypothetical protein HYX58_05545 [Candidatus Dependentiae bacterium]|nr:hypothetical protein [Candidatus Dependentiae bacterium]